MAKGSGRGSGKKSDKGKEPVSPPRARPSHTDPDLRLNSSTSGSSSSSSSSSRIPRLNLRQLPPPGGWSDVPFLNLRGLPPPNSWVPREPVIDLVRAEDLTPRSKLLAEKLLAEIRGFDKALMRRADYGVVHPNLPYIRTRRFHDEGPNRRAQPGFDFADHLIDTRASIRHLMSGSVGHRMLTELNSLSVKFEPAPTVVDIYSASFSWAEYKPDYLEGDPRARNYIKLAEGEPPTKLWGDHSASTIDDKQDARRYGGEPGKGARAKIRYDTLSPSAIRFTSLGHELVHAWRFAHGVSVDSSSFPANAPDSFEINMHAYMTEEFETVGLLPTPDWVPTENKILAELKDTFGRRKITLRDDYTREVPGDWGNFPPAISGRRAWRKDPKREMEVQLALSLLEQPPWGALAARPGTVSGSSSSSNAWVDSRPR